MTRIISLDAAIGVVMEYFPGNTINDPKYAAGKSLVEALSALPAVDDDARIAELEAAVERLRAKAEEWQLADGRY